MGVTNFWLHIAINLVSVWPNQRTVQVSPYHIRYSIKWKFHIAVKYIFIFMQNYLRNGQSVAGRRGRGSVNWAWQVRLGQMRWFSRLHDARTTSAAWPVKIITLKLILFMRMCVRVLCVCVGVFVWSLCVCASVVFARKCAMQLLLRFLPWKLLVMQIANEHK